MLLVASSQPALPDHAGDGCSSYIVDLSFICLGWWLWGKDEVRRHRAIGIVEDRTRITFLGLAYGPAQFFCTRIQLLTSLSILSFFLSLCALINSLPVLRTHHILPCSSRISFIDLFLTPSLLILFFKVLYSQPLRYGCQKDPFTSEEKHFSTEPLGALLSNVWPLCRTLS